MPVVRRKLVVVGDGQCGKTSLLWVFARGMFPEVFVPTIFESYVMDASVDGRQVEVELWDTAGQEDYDRLRPLSYPNSHVVLICYSIACSDSLENVVEKWFFEVRNFCPGVPFILVGCKKDLRSGHDSIDSIRRHGQTPVTPEQGRVVAKRIAAHGFFECSARKGDGIDELFECAVRASLIVVKPPRRTKCIVA